MSDLKIMNPKDTLTDLTILGALPTAPNTDKLQVKYAYTKFKSQKPRRNKSAFILFSQKARLELKGLEELNSNQIMVKLAELWKELPEEEKTAYNLQAKNDKDRYQSEMTEFLKSHPDQKFSNKTKNNHVKKPCSSYALYLKARRSYFKENHPEFKMAEVLKHVSLEWKNLDAKTKAIYQKQADAQKSDLQSRICETIMNDQKKLNVKITKEGKKRRTKKLLKAGQSEEPRLEMVRENNLQCKLELDNFEPTLMKKQMMEPKIEVKNEDTMHSTKSVSSVQSFVKHEEPLTIKEENHMRSLEGLTMNSGVSYSKVLSLLSLQARQHQFNNMLMEVLKIHAALGYSQPNNNNMNMFDFYGKMLRAAQSMKESAAQTLSSPEAEKKLLLGSNLLDQAKSQASAK